MIAPVDISNVYLETERLILRPWREADLEDLYTYASVDGVGEMAGWPHHENRDVSHGILERFIRERKTFALELKETGAVIGSLGIEEGEPAELTDSGLCGRELGYVLGKAYWGRGLMTEAVAEVIRYCFEELKFDFLICCHFVRNEQSRRVIEKSGFEYLRDIEYRTWCGEVERHRMYIRYNPNKTR